MKIPASYHQERLWFIDTFEKGSLYESSPIYHNIPIVLEIKGSLQKEKLEKSIGDAIQRHEALRTRIITEKEKPFQGINSDFSFCLDLQKVERDNRDKEYDRALTRVLKESQKPFDIERDLLIRGTLLEYHNQAYLLVITMHHLIADYASLHILTRDILLQYDAYCREKPAQLPGITLQYLDFSQWQRQLPVKLNESMLSYWKAQLAGKLQALELPVDRPRALIHTYKSETIDFRFPRDLSAKLTAFSQQEAIAPSTILLAAFKILLQRYSGHDEIIVGISTENRNQPGLENSVGPFANLLATRDNLSREWSFRQISRAQEVTVKGALKHQYIPFDKLVLELNPQKDMSRTALFDVLFQYRENSLILPSPQDLEIKYIETNLGWGKYDLNQLMWEESDIFQGVMVYNADLFDRPTISRMIGHFQKLLREFMDEPSQQSGKIELLTDREKEELLSFWNHNSAGYPDQKTIQDILEDQMSQRPFNIALKGRSLTIQGGHTLEMSYRFLEERSGKIAKELKLKGVGPGIIVALKMDRNVEMIIAILAVIKAGGIYLPINPDYPQDRMDFMLADSAAPIMIKDAHAGDKASQDSICIESLHQIPETGSKNSTDSSPQDAVYIIYTSGTTGRPKGVLVEHRNLVRLMTNDKFQFQFTQSDIWTLFHSYCFDFSVWEMYGALLYGAKLIVIPSLTAKETSQFRELLTKEGVTVLNQTPSAFYALSDLVLKGEKQQESKPDNLYLKYIIFGGEALNPARLADFKDAYPETRLINMYGITETTVHVTFKEIGTKEIKNHASNIGTPIPTLTTYVFDKEMNLQALGIPGEYCIGGEGVARGYLNRPDLTMEKFIENPYKPGEQLYRSGDLVKLIPGGETEYLGRIDRQVKIRGFRIELGEIENKLLTHREIKKAVVLLTAIPGSNEQPEETSSVLTAYIIGERQLTIAEIKQHLAATLPDYMIPTFLVQMKEFQLTANGKLDYNALPSPEISRTHTFTPPNTGIEKKLAEIWAGLLNIQLEKLSRSDNFFDMGGHSLTAVKLIAQSQKKFNVKIPLSEIFKAPTIYELAKYIENSGPDYYISIKPVEKREYYGLSSAQKRMYVVNRMYPKNLGLNVFQAFYMEGEIHKSKIEKAFSLLMKRHESLRTYFQMVDEAPVQRIDHHTEMKVASYSCRSGEEAKSITEFIKPFDLSAAPLLRVGLIQNSDNKHLLMLDIHHIVVDGGSFENLARDIIAIYKNENLPPLRLQYKDYAQWQNHFLESEAMKKQENYWVEQLNHPLPLLDIPTDFPRTEKRTFKSDSVIFSIDKQLTGQLKAIIDETGSTFHMVLLGIFTILLSKYSGQNDIIVGSASAGRRHADLQNIIGPFVNMLAMRNRVKEELTVHEFLMDVKKNALDAYENQDFQFDDLVHKLGIKRELGKHPIFDVQFTFENATPGKRGKETPAEMDFSLKPYKHEIGMRQFELSLTGSTNQAEISLKLKYLTDLFKKETAQNMATHFVEIVKLVVKNRKKTLKEIAISQELTSVDSLLNKEEISDFGF